MDSTVRNIILVGRTGNGKSSTCNSILGKRVFISRRNSSNATIECQKSQVKTHSGLIINVIDTPGLFDSSDSSEYLSREIIKCLELAEGGIHALVLVLSVRRRVTQEEDHTLATLQRLFGGKILDYVVVLFTGGDELEAHQQTLDDYLRQGCPEFFMGVLRLCGGRKVLFNNKTANKMKQEEQVQQLLAHVQEIGDLNNGIPFKHDIHLQIEEGTEKRLEQRKLLEFRNLGEFEEAKKQLEMMYEHNMREMREMVEKVMRENEALRNGQELQGMQEENEIFWEQRKPVESQNRREAELVEITEMLEKKLQEASTVNERRILTLKENLDKAMTENEALRNGQEHTRVKLDISVPSANPPNLSVMYICFLLFGVVYCVFSYT